MPHFIRNSAVALTWMPSGECRGVRLKRTGNTCKVVGFWAGTADFNHAAPEILAEGAKALNAKDAACYLGSCLGNGWDAADVTLPKLPPAQRYNALAFELRKHTPIPADRLVWGYRQLTRGDRNAPATYRLIFVKQDLWKRWCDTFTGTTPIDAIMPAPTVLDPLCNKLTVTFPHSDATAEAYLPTPQGRTFKTTTTKDANGLDIPLTELLAADFVRLGELESLPVTEQYDYADAIMLAAYGLTDEATHDVETLLPLPAALKPHRSMSLVISACVLIAIAIAAGVLVLAMTIKSNVLQQQELKRSLARIDTEINRLRRTIRPEHLKKIQELEEELAGEIPNYPPIPLVLNELSEIITPYLDNKPWIPGRMHWNHDSNKLTFSVEEPLQENSTKAFIERPELIDELADCPYILDVRANSSVINRTENKCVREFTITLGWQEKDRRLAAMPRNKQRAERRKAERERREKLLREAKERARQEALQQEDMQDDQDEKTAKDAPKHLTPQTGAPPLRGIGAPPPPPNIR